MSSSPSRTEQQQQQQQPPPSPEIGFLAGFNEEDSRSSSLELAVSVPDMVDGMELSEDFEMGEFDSQFNTESFLATFDPVSYDSPIPETPPPVVAQPELAADATITHLDAFNASTDAIEHERSTAFCSKAERGIAHLTLRQLYDLVSDKFAPAQYGYLIHRLRTHNPINPAVLTEEALTLPLPYAREALFRILFLQSGDHAARVYTEHTFQAFITIMCAILKSKYDAPHKTLCGSTSIIDRPRRTSTGNSRGRYLRGRCYAPVQLPCSDCSHATELVHHLVRYIAWAFASTNLLSLLSAQCIAAVSKQVDQLAVDVGITDLRVRDEFISYMSNTSIRTLGGEVQEHTRLRPSTVLKGASARVQAFSPAFRAAFFNQ